MISFLLKNWKEFLGAGLVIALLIALGVAHARGYHACKTDTLAAAQIQTIDLQAKGITALDAEMLSAQIASDKKNTVTIDIGKTHATDDNAPAPAVLQSVLGDLYGK
jgi:hypothetical protein